VKSTTDNGSENQYREQEIKETKKTVANSLLKPYENYVMKFQKKNPFLLCNFSDAALHKNERPMSDTELLAIDGVGKAKLEKYGDAFIKVQDFQKAKGTKRKKEATTYKETLEL
jgi:ATP-dependent DNA helicase RecQ